MDDETRDYIEKWLTSTPADEVIERIYQYMQTEALYEAFLREWKGGYE